MIQSTQLTIPAANTSAIQQRVEESSTDTQEFQNILAQSTTTDTTAAETDDNAAASNSDTSSLAPYLYELLGNTNPASLNEEQLFAGIIHERLVATKGEDVAAQYDAALEEHMAASGRGDGYIFIEKAARAALQDLEEQGVLTLEEAETIHAQAFQAAQLDSNKNALYDSRGATQSVASTETALESALATLLKFDAGELESGRMSLTFTQGEQAAIASDGANTGIGKSLGNSGDVMTGTPASDITGIRWNPDSTGVGTLAVVMPSKLQDISRAYVTDSQGDVVEEGRHTSEDKGRLVYRFDEKGSAYPSPSILNVEMGDGSVYKFKINSPGSLTTNVIPYLS